MSRNPDDRYFRATLQKDFNKSRDVVDPSRTDLTSWLVYKTSKKAGPFPKDSWAH
jgi:hypothetical protein